MAHAEKENSKPLPPNVYQSVISMNNESPDKTNSMLSSSSDSDSNQLSGMVIVCLDQQKKVHRLRNDSSLEEMHTSSSQVMTTSSVDEEDQETI